MNFRTVSLPLIMVSLFIVSCKKEVEQVDSSPRLYKEGGVSEEEIPCDYILDPAPQPLISMIDSDDPVEEKLNLYLYLIAKATSRYTCTVDFESAFNATKFNRYDGTGESPAQDEATINELIAYDSNYESYLLAEFYAAGEDWNIAKNDFQWQGFDYEPTIWLENKAHADWQKSELIGVGTDVEYVKESFGDFIPAFYNDCRPEQFEPTEMVLGKVDREFPFDSSYVYPSTCISNPILVVQLSWAENVRSKAFSSTGTIPTQWLGTNYDTLIPLIDPPGCNQGLNYDMIAFNAACNRFERGRKSEIRLRHWDIPTNVASGPAYQNVYYGSKKKKIGNIHKDDICDKVNLSIFMDNVQNGLTIGDIDRNVYMVTYEYDWYASFRNWKFPNDQGVTPEIGMQRKGSHEHYQIGVIYPTDWCLDRVKYYTDPHSSMFFMCYN